MMNSDAVNSGWRVGYGGVCWMVGCGCIINDTVGVKEA